MILVGNDGSSYSGGTSLPTDRRLYIDLDCVIFDFDAHYRALFGTEPRDVSDKVLWDNINSVPTFFRDIPLCEGALDFFRLIQHLDPIILTACPKSDYVRVAGAKRAAVREHLGDHVVVLPVTGGVNKVLFMHRQGDILVDDHPRNIRSWRDGGGSGILHRNFDLTVWALRDELGDSELLGDWPPSSAAAPTLTSLGLPPEGPTTPSGAYALGVLTGTVLGLSQAAEALGIDLGPGDNTPERILEHLAGKTPRYARAD